MSYLERYDILDIPSYIPSYNPRRQSPYSLDFEAYYASDALRCAIHKSSARAQREGSWREDFVLELGLEGVPVVAAVLALIGVVWTISAVSSHDRIAYIFPAIYMTIGFGMLYFVSNNVKKRFRQARQPRLIPLSQVRLYVVDTAV